MILKFKESTVTMDLYTFMAKKTIWLKMAFQSDWLNIVQDNLKVLKHIS